VFGIQDNSFDGGANRLQVSFRGRLCSVSVNRMAGAGFSSQPRALAELNVRSESVEIVELHQR
jgi:hypothetical protein